MAHKAPKRELLNYSKSVNHRLGNVPSKSSTVEASHTLKIACCKRRIREPMYIYQITLLQSKHVAHKSSKIIQGSSISSRMLLLFPEQLDCCIIDADIINMLGAGPEAPPSNATLPTLTWSATGKQTVKQWSYKKWHGCGWRKAHAESANQDVQQHKAYCKPCVQVW